MEEQKLNHTVVSVVSSITNMNNNEETKATITTVPLPPPPSSYAVAEVTAMIAAQGNSGRGSVGKKKRGRPRKYDSDGKLNERYQSPKSPPGFTLSPTQPNKACGKSSFGEAFANSAGGDFTPHVVTIYKGEDVSGKIMAFVQKSPGGICIVSANGPISNVAIRQPDSSGGILTYEGLFEILSLSGSFAVSENSDIRSRSGGLSVLLAGPDGRVLGGAVAGLLTAAGPIQIVMGSFIPNGTKTHKKKQNRKHTAASPISGGPDTVTATRPLSQENPNVDGDNFHLVMSQLQEQSNIESVSVTTSGDTQNIDATPNAAATRNGSNELSDQRVSPDINISLQDE
ncbi:putative PPC domain-containing protein [Lupinus albus]|uniref:AT-hook motif nuclear-localized protein n=1 Tax=Lupinus albus TaxID=3870 RepID=A0A6A4QXS4_LUPAL|nr:putative PPC domain-containing protein [Lupinus albus]